MEYIDHKITLDVHDTVAPVSLSLKRRETGHRLLIRLADKGYPYHISDDCYAVFTAKKADGEVIFNNCTIEDCVIAYEITEQTVAVTGLLNCEIQLYGADSKLLVSPSFYIVIVDTLYDEQAALESTTEYLALTDLISGAATVIKTGNEAIDQWQHAVEEAQEATNDAKNAAGSAILAAVNTNAFLEAAQQHVSAWLERSESEKTQLFQNVVSYTGECIEEMNAAKETMVADANAAVEAANTAAGNADNATQRAETAIQNVNQATANTNQFLDDAMERTSSWLKESDSEKNRIFEQVRTDTDTCIEELNTAKETMETDVNAAVEAANIAAGNADNATQRTEAAIKNANQAASNTNAVIATANQSIEAANTATVNAANATSDANAAKDTALEAAGNANRSKEAADTATSNANAAATNANAAATAANTAKESFLQTAGDALEEIRNVVNDGADAPPIVCSSTGSVLAIDDAANRLLQGLKIFGKTTQNGTPTPEAPVPLESVGDNGSVTVSITAKNIFGGEALADKLAAVSNAVKDTEAGTVTFNCQQVSNKIIFNNFKPNTQYTFFIYGRNSSATGTAANLAVYYTDGSSEGAIRFSIANEDAYYVLTTRPNKTVRNLMGYYSSGNTILHYDQCGIFEGILTEADFEHYQGQSLNVQKPEDAPVFLPGIPVASGGNYTDENGQQWVCDEVDFVRGKYVSILHELTFDGVSNGKRMYNTDTSQLNTNSTNIYAYINSTYMGVKMLNRSANLCNYKTSVGTSTALSLTLPRTFLGIADFEADRSVIVAAFNEKLKELYDAGNPLRVLYIRESPIEYDLTAEELAAYAALHTNYPNTTIFNDGGADMEVKYVEDTKLYIDKKFAELAQAMLNQ